MAHTQNALFTTDGIRFKLSCSFFGPFHSELDFGDASREGATR